jgi:hypothetical protein
MRSNRWLGLGALALSMGLQAANGQEATGTKESVTAAPAELIAEQDHGRLMKLLGIEALWPGADGWRKDVPNAANYDEAKVARDIRLPDPLTLESGGRVAATDAWWNVRRPEIVELFDREVYGRAPEHTPAVRWEAAGTEQERVADVPVVTRKLVGHVENSTYPPVTVDIDLTVTTPADGNGPVPVIMEFGWDGRQGPTWKDQLVARRWRHAVIVPTSYPADNGGGLTKGIIGLCSKGRPRDADDWGALRAWAWGASHALDYFQTDPAVDSALVDGEVAFRQHSAGHTTGPNWPTLIEFASRYLARPE